LRASLPDRRCDDGRHCSASNTKPETIESQLALDETS
jgi:hypothetical protein